MDRADGQWRRLVVLPRQRHRHLRMHRSGGGAQPERSYKMLETWNDRTLIDDREREGSLGSGLRTVPAAEQRRHLGQH